MFGFFRKEPDPPLCPSNPGIGIEAKVGFANGERSWTEAANVVKLAAAVFQRHRLSVVNEKTRLRHPASGFVILPQIVAIQPMDKGAVRTVTTMQVHHPTLTPDGLFEYQHSAADTVAEAISQGIDQWVQTDFVTLLDALRPQPETCTMMGMTFGPEDGKSARSRRAVLGPVAHFLLKPPAETHANGAEEHPFCSCCLLTNTFEAFKELIQGDGFYGLRLYAARSAEGEPMADCRVNGDDYERGAEALRKYVNTWPEAGFEFRKQYVVLQSVDGEG